MANARVTQSAIEFLDLPDPNARLTQSVVEYIVGLGVQCNNPPAGAVGAIYVHSFTAGGSSPPITFAITAGTLPPGLALNGVTGGVSGTPTSAGTFNFTVTATDALTQTASVDCSILIAGSSSVSISLYGFKRFRKDPCAELEALPVLPPVKRVL